MLSSNWENYNEVTFVGPEDTKDEKWTICERKCEKVGGVRCLLRTIRDGWHVYWRAHSAKGRR